MSKALEKATSTRVDAVRSTNVRLAGLLIAVVAVANSPLQADVVAARGRRPLVNTRVLRLDAGRLIYEAEAGQELSAPVEQLDYLQITGWQMFNLAEKQRRAEDWRRAAVSYERALADLQLDEQTDERGVERGDLDRALLVKCRMIPAWDAQRRFDRAVELYMEAIASMPEVVDALRPLNFPETGSQVLEMAARPVDEMIARRGNDEIARSLKAWRATWPARPMASSLDKMASPTATHGDDRRSRERIGRVADLVEKGHFTEALALIDECHKQTSGGLRANLFYWQGRALESLHAAKVAAADPPATQPVDSTWVARAGMTYMRVVVHFPQHPLAAECLYRAADLARQSGLHEQAAAMWAELIGTYPLARTSKGELWAEKAREELK